MTAKDIVQHACIDAHVTMAYVAEKMNMSRSQFNNRLNTGKFTIEEWSKLNEVIGNNLIAEYMAIAISYPREQGKRQLQKQLQRQGFVPVYGAKHDYQNY